MHETIYICLRFFARQPQLKVLNSNKRMVKHLLIKPDVQKCRQSIVSSVGLNEFPASVMRLQNFLLY